MNLKISAWAAIISAILIIPSSIIAFLFGLNSESELLRFLFYIMVALGVLVLLPLFLGYVRIAKLNKLKFLEIMMYTSLMATIIVTAYSIFLENDDSIFGLILFVLKGVIILLSGIALFKLKSVFGGVVTAIGVLYIINGVFLASIILVFFLPFTYLATNILEAILFFRASKKYD